MNGMRSRQGRRGPAAPGGVAALFWRGRRARALLGLGLALLAAGASAGLLGAAGWLIVGAGMTAEARDDAALAALLAGGAVGAGLAVRILAGVRTIARYAERMTTHDVTFRFLAELRGRLFRALAAQPWDRIERLRKGVALGRLTADVDALDGLYLRLLLPTLTMTGASLALGAALFWWVGPIASAAAVSPLLIALAATRVSAATSRVEARRRAAAIDAVRVRAIDLAAAQPVWAMAGRLEEQRARALDAGARAARAAARLHRSERRAGAWFAIATQGAAAAVFLATALQRDALGALTPLYAAAAALATLALGELATPLRRAALDRGRTHLSDRRLSPLLNAAPDEADEDAHALAPPPIAPRAPALRLSRVAVRRPGGPLSPRLTLAARPGEVVAIRGRSGSGKSSILAAAAGLIPAEIGEIDLFGAPIEDWPEAELRALLAMAPQRTELIAGSIAENLRLADPEASDEDLWSALDAAALARDVDQRGGLSTMLGENGLGLSGGQARRFALARVLLRRPSVALLDEPTEGLDRRTAVQALDGVLAELAHAAVVIASHRPEDLDRADRVIDL